MYLALCFQSLFDRAMAHHGAHVAKRPPSSDCGGRPLLNSSRIASPKALSPVRVTYFQSKLRRLRPKSQQILSYLG